MSLSGSCRSCGRVTPVDSTINMAQRDRVRTTYLRNNIFKSTSRSDVSSTLICDKSGAESNYPRRSTRHRKKHASRGRAAAPSRHAADSEDKHNICAPSTLSKESSTKPREAGGGHC